MLFRRQLTPEQIRHRAYHSGRAISSIYLIASEDVAVRTAQVALQVLMAQGAPYHEQLVICYPDTAQYPGTWTVDINYPVINYDGDEQLRAMARAALDAAFQVTELVGNYSV